MIKKFKGQVVLSLAAAMGLTSVVADSFAQRPVRPRPPIGIRPPVRPLPPIVRPPVVRPGIQEVQLQFGDQQFRGSLNLIDLKRAIRDQRPGLNLHRAQLLSVKVIAKSRAGQAQASLLINGQNRMSQTVPGNRRDWELPYRQTFHHLTLVPVAINHRPVTQGDWAIQFNGNVKLRRIVVTLEDRPGPGPGPLPPRVVYQHLDEIKAPKIITGYESVRVDLSGVATIKLTSTNKTVSVSRVTAVLENGLRQDLHELEGTYREGRSQIAHIPGGGRARGARVSHLIIESTSLNLSGGRGRLSVDAGVIRRFGVR